MTKNNETVISLEKARKERSNKASDWTPLDALKTTVEAIESGKVDPSAIYIAMQIGPDEDGNVGLWDVCAGAENNFEIAGLLMAHVNKLTRGR